MPGMGFVVTLLLLVGGATAQQRSQVIRFFNTIDCRPAGIGLGYEEYRKSGNVSRGTGSGFNSYCVMSGAWRIDYVNAMTPSDMNISLGDLCSHCVYKGQGNQKQWGIVHLIVGDDLTRPSISLYPERNFTGTPLHITGYEYTFQSSQSFASFAFTSFGNFTWELFHLPRWGGNNSTCRRSSAGSEVTLVNLDTTISVGSVRLGCRNPISDSGDDTGSGVERPQIIRFFYTNDCRPQGNGLGYEEYRRSGNVSRGTGTGFSSYCVVSGAWRVDYANAMTASDMNISIGDFCSSCVFKGQGNTRQWGAVHIIVGDDLDLARPSLSLYSNRDFTGQSLQISQDEHSFSNIQSFSSFAFTSFWNWTWELYYEPGWMGNSTCYRSSEREEVTLIYPTALTIGSIRRGCSKQSDHLPGTSPRSTTTTTTNRNGDGGDDKPSGTNASYGPIGFILNIMIALGHLTIF